LIGEDGCRSLPGQDVDESVANFDELFEVITEEQDEVDGD